MEITFEDIQRANEQIRTTDIKGKEYAEVNQRIKAFRMVYPKGTIKTEMESNKDGICIFKAYVYEYYLQEPSGLLSLCKSKLLATGTAYEKENSSFINKTSYIENCETSAIGRALGMAGFGIDTSIASYEEVENATLQQEMNTKISKIKADVLYSTMLGKGLTEEKIHETLQKNYGVETVYELTMGQHGQILNKLNKLESEEK